MKTKLLALSVVLAFNAGAAFAGPGAPPGDFGAEHAYPQGSKLYVAGTTVSNVGKKFECQPFPASGYCSQYSPSANQYEPGVGTFWQMAWIDITPEKETEFGYDFAFPVHQGHYKAGTKVAQNGLVYECKDLPHGGFCSQGGAGNEQYDPGVGHAWSEAWIEVGPAGQQKSGL